MSGTIIKDCIYRFIHVPELCKQFMDTVEFQRLRNIKQLGLAYFVFPSAVHTRLEHSLGVMHLAGVVVDELRYHGEYITQREKEILQLAGLLHDVGHMAFSHLFDYMLEENGHDLLHEDRSISVLLDINNRLNLLTDTEILQISHMIHGNIPIKGDIKSGEKYIEEKKYFLYEIVSNSAFGLDVDRLDYLQRDSYHTGMPSFQPDYLISCLRVKNGRLAVLPKAKPEIEMLYETRKRLITLVCRHKTVIAIEKLIRQGITCLEYIKNWEELTKGGWMKLDDVEVYHSLRKKFPKIVHTIETRSWDRSVPNNRFEHITLISRDSIDKKLEDVNWV
jgi:HD superfamily phosphohydrolase